MTCQRNTSMTRKHESGNGGMRNGCLDGDMAISLSVSCWAGYKLSPAFHISLSSPSCPVSCAGGPVVRSRYPVGALLGSQAGNSYTRNKPGRAAPQAAVTGSAATELQELWAFSGSGDAGSRKVYHAFTISLRYISFHKHVLLRLVMLARDPPHNLLSCSLSKAPVLQCLLSLMA